MEGLVLCRTLTQELTEWIKGSPCLTSEISESLKDITLLHGRWVLFKWEWRTVAFWLHLSQVIFCTHCTSAQTAFIRLAIGVWNLRNFKIGLLALLWSFWNSLWMYIWPQWVKKKVSVKFCDSTPAHYLERPHIWWQHKLYNTVNFLLHSFTNDLLYCFSFIRLSFSMPGLSIATMLTSVSLLFILELKQTKAIIKNNHH